MKRAIETILNAFVLFILVYLPIAFIQAEFNPLNWNVFVRCLYVLCVISLITFGYKQINK